ncbi:tyrosine-type recombinase/integrase [Gluconacetobacter tumulicola]|uniref:Site-specific integrase n=1 Tax=Gluconacetobacter tumulicola TaxID=1017177 RepID=A0A7W4JGZ5_9PROT|nr:site-specific integrase [Gluconacetobacter tumulicola]MBB2181085.1 site-specific integrase [Gluconacetobacter tumulicola]
MKLTKREIDVLACPPGKRDALFMDDEVRGFAIRVTETGSKVFLFQYRFAGRVRRLVLGPYGDLTPAQARKLAEEARGRVLAGGDPVGERKAHALAAQAEIIRRKAEAAAYVLTLDRLIGRWQEGPLQDRSPSYAKEGPARLRASLPKLLGSPARAITTAEIQTRLDDVARNHPVSARRLHALGRSMFGWAEKRGLVPANPFTGAIPEGRDISRERVLTDLELAAIWNAAGRLPYPFGPFFRLLTLTLQRRDEVAGMSWAELSPDLTIWTLPAERAKNGRAHIVHLSEPARHILAGLPRQPDPKTDTLSPYVFTTTGRAPISGFSKAKTRLEQAMAKAVGTPPGKEASSLPDTDWRLHDLRRTGVTVMARLGIGHHVADRVLNHVQGAIKGVAAVYQGHEFEAERAAALDSWGRHVLTVAEGRTQGQQAGNVVPLRPQA